MSIKKSLAALVLSAWASLGIGGMQSRTIDPGKVVELPAIIKQPRPFPAQSIDHIFWASEIESTNQNRTPKLLYTSSDNSYTNWQKVTSSLDMYLSGIQRTPCVSLDTNNSPIGFFNAQYTSLSTNPPFSALIYFYHGSNSVRGVTNGWINMFIPNVYPSTNDALSIANSTNNTKYVVGIGALKADSIDKKVFCFRFSGWGDSLTRISWIDTSPGDKSEPHIVVDSTNGIHITYRDNNTRVVKRLYSPNDITTRVYFVVCSNVYDSDLTIDANDNLFLAYKQWTNGNTSVCLKEILSNNTWVLTNGVVTPTNRTVAISIDRQNNRRVAWTQYGISNLHLYASSITNHIRPVLIDTTTNLDLGYVDIADDTIVANMHSLVQYHPLQPIFLSFSNDVNNIYTTVGNLDELSQYSVSYSTDLITWTNNSVIQPDSDTHIISQPTTNKMMFFRVQK